MTAGKLALRFIATATLATAALALSSAVNAQVAADLKCRGCVGSKDIGRNAVTKKSVRTGAIDSRAIRDGSVGPGDLAAAAKPTGVDFAEDPVTAAIPDSVGSMISTTLTAPVPGFAVVFASWFYSTGAGVSASCYLGTEAGVADGAPDIMLSGTNTNYRETGGLVRTFAVPAGDTAVHLNCKDEGTGAYIGARKITALFVPNRY